MYEYGNSTLLSHISKHLSITSYGSPCAKNQQIAPPVDWTLHDQKLLSQ